jgi:hypothetical protein
MYCFALMGAYRARQFVSGKAPFAGIAVPDQP